MNTEKRVMNCIQMILEEGMDACCRELDLHEDLTALGLNSMNYVKLVVKLEDEFNITIDEEDLSLESFNTLSKLVDYVERNSGL